MSFVTTPTRHSPASSRHSAAIRLLLPEPTGPPTPTRRARSAGKEALPSSLVDRRGNLERDSGRGGLLGDGPPVGGRLARRALHLRRQLRQPARGAGGVERQQLE